LTYLLICLGSAVLRALIALRKGSSVPVWFVVGAVVPLLGPIAAVLYRRETEVPLRRCPSCGAATRIHDAVCMTCGSDLSYPETSELIEPTPLMRVRAKL
jgi:ribosomal protein L32